MPFIELKGIFSYIVSAAGSISGMMATLKENSRLKGRSISRYKSVRSQYIGQSNGDYDGSEYKKLTPAQLIEGRQRAKAYYARRNIRIYTQIVVLLIVACTLVGFAVRYLLA